MLDFIKKVRSFFLPPTYEGFYEDISSLSAFKKNYQENQLISIYLNEILLDSNPLATRQNGIRESLKEHLLQNATTIRVLDFGGGAIELYSWIISNDLPIDQVEYSLLETPKMVAALKLQQTLNIRNIKLLSEFDFEDNYDIIFVGSSLQYFKDYKQTVAYLSNHCRSLYIEDIPISNHSRFASLQVNVKNFGSEGLPVWIFNERELIDDLNNTGLQLTYSEIHRNRVKIKNGPKKVQCKSKSFIFKQPK